MFLKKVIVENYKYFSFKPLKITSQTTFFLERNCTFVLPSVEVKV
jgi:hypothetical protein